MPLGPPGRDLPLVRAGPADRQGQGVPVLPARGPGHPGREEAARARRPRVALPPAARTREITGACRDCGDLTLLSGGLCKACRLFRRCHPVGTCPWCGRVQPIGAAGACRSCQCAAGPSANEPVTHPRPRPVPSPAVPPPLDVLVGYRLAIVDEGFVGDQAGLMLGPPGGRVLDPKTAALVRVGVLAAIGAPEVCLEWGSSQALAAGASEDEFTGVLLTIAPVIGLGRIVGAVPGVAGAFDYDIEAALDDPGAP